MITIRSTYTKEDVNEMLKGNYDTQITDGVWKWTRAIFKNWANEIPLNDLAMICRYDNWRIKNKLGQ